MTFTNYRFIYYILFCTFVIYGDIYSQSSQKLISDSVKIDNSKTVVTKVPDVKLEKYKSDRNFDYSVKEPEKSTFSSYISYLIRKILNAIFSNKGKSPYIRNTIAAIILALAIFFIYRANFQTLFMSNASDKNKNQLAYSTEDINEENLELKLQNSIEENNFRLAIRFYYILLLKNLDSKNLIKWELGKTNKDYKYELKDKNIYNKFSSLSSLYEYSWYGNFEISKYNFNNYKNNFDLLLNEVEGHK